MYHLTRHIRVCECAPHVSTYISVPGYLLTMGNATSRDPVGPYHSPARPAPSVHYRTPPYTPPSDKPLILFINPQRGINIAPSPQHARGERDVVNDGNTFAASTGIRECGRRTFNSTLSRPPLLSCLRPSRTLLDSPVCVGFSVCVSLSIRASLSDLMQWNVGWN